jgi:hypothetical protein
MEFVLVKLDADAALDAIEGSEVAGAELRGGTDLGNGRGRRMSATTTGDTSPNGGRAGASEVPSRDGGGTSE